MRGSYFYKRTLISFSVFTFSLLTIILFFVNYRINVFYDYILEKSQKQLNAGVEIFEEDIEAEVFSYIEKVRERNQNDINHIPTETVFLNKTQLSNMKLDEYTTRSIKLYPKDEYNTIVTNRTEYTDSLIFLSVKKVVIDDKEYYLEQRDRIDKDFIKKIRRQFLKKGEVLPISSLDNKNLKEKFETRKLDKFIEKSGVPYDLYRVYIPIYNEKNEFIAYIIYEVDISILSKLDSSLSDDSDYFFKTAKIYVILFSFAFYAVTLGLIVLFLKNIYDPLDEVFGVIDDLSKGKFGKKIFLENRDELKPLVRKINRLSGNLNFINRIKTEFLLKKSYEFKEVLDNVVGISEELIKNKDIEENVKDELKIVYENSNRLLAITKGLNDYYILDDESIKIEQSINLRRIVEESITVLSNEIRDKNLSVENQISERIYINGDSLKLFLLITNLLENSVKNSEDFSEIEIGAIILGTVLRVNISDRGRGIFVDKLLSLQSYFRDESEPEDIGLGFVLAKKIVELHGGKIELWSKEDVGTRISFVLKDAISINDRSREKLDELKREVTLDTVYGDKKILIFCNNYFNCQVLINFLKDKDFNIRITETKGEMEKYLEQENYDILIMDIFGDFISDYKIIKWVREKYDTKELPIIFINNRKRVEEELNVFDLGINDIVEKPISKDKLMIKIENQLKIKLSQRVNETLEKERELVESISEIQGEISSTLDTKKIFFILLKRIKELFDFDSALVLLKREKKYGVIFQEGHIEKEERNDRLFKSRYLDPVTNTGRIVRLNTYKCKKYFGEKVKSGLVIPFKYGANNNCVMILKSKTEGFFRDLPKDILDKISNNLTNSIKNSELYNELEEKNIYLNSLLEMLQSIDKLITVVYKEQDKVTAIYYILLILVNKIKLGYKEAYFFQHDEDTKVLSCTNYYYNLKNYTEEKENRVTAKEIWSNRIRIKEEKNNILTRAFKNNESFYDKELTTEDGELFGKLLRVTVIPVRYSDNKFGLIVLENERKKKNVDEIEKEALRIISANLGIYLHSKKLEEERAKASSSETLNSFAKAIIHELRTPIVGVKGFASLVKEKYSEDGKLVTYMNNIITNSERVLDLSSQIVDYAEEENRNYQYIEEDITKTINEVLDEFKDDIELEDLEIDKPSEPCYLIFDKMRIKRVFRHIIKNTIENIDYEKDDNGLRISIDKNKNGSVNISFLDNGVGIDEDFLGSIFNPLVSAKIQGTGLGLPIAKSIIEKHNWKIRVESVKYNYTRVVIVTK